jgi:hypothetical protein
LTRLHKEVVEGDERLIDQVKIENRLRGNLCQWDSRKIERATIPLYPIRAFNHRALQRKAMHPTDEGPPSIQTATAAIQEYTGLWRIDLAPGIRGRMQPLQETLARLWL